MGDLCISGTDLQFIWCTFARIIEITQQNATYLYNVTTEVSIMLIGIGNKDLNGLFVLIKLWINPHIFTDVNFKQSQWNYHQCCAIFILHFLITLIKLIELRILLVIGEDDFRIQISLHFTRNNQAQWFKKITWHLFYRDYHRSNNVMKYV